MKKAPPLSGAGSTREVVVSALGTQDDQEKENIRPTVKPYGGRAYLSTFMLTPTS